MVKQTQSQKETVSVTIDAALFSMNEGKKERVSTLNALVRLASQGVLVQINKATDPFPTAPGVTVMIDAALFLIIESKKERVSTKSALGCRAAEDSTLQIEISKDVSKCTGCECDD